MCHQDYAEECLVGELVHAFHRSLKPITANLQTQREDLAGAL